MKVVVQRVLEASVSAEGRITAATGKGFLCLAGIAGGDTPEEVLRLAGRTAGLRVFEDSSGRMNLDIKQISGEILSVPQFTLLGRTGKGNRPSFEDAAEPEKAAELWERYNGFLAECGIPVKRGVFGKHMEISLINDGPVTIILESREKTP